MPNETAEDFIAAADMDYQTIEELRYFDFDQANSACYHAQQYAERWSKLN